MSGPVCTVTRTDFDGPEDEDGSASIVGHFDTEEEAEAAAEEIFEAEDRDNVTRDGEYLRDNFFDTPTLQVTVECKEVARKRKVAAPPPQAPRYNSNKYGEMISIPRGRMGALRRAEFFIDKDLKLETLSVHQVFLTVRAYGGWPVSSDLDSADYIMVPDQGSSKHFPKFRHRLLTENKFYKLLQKGVPEGGPLDAEFHAKLFGYHVASTADEVKNTSTSTGMEISAIINADEPAAKRQKTMEVVQID